MRRLFACVLAAVIIISSAVMAGEPVRLEAADAPVQIIINGAVVNADVEPVIVQDRTMVPVRVIAEYLGKKVDWDQRTQTVIINSDPAALSQAPERNKPAYIALLVDGRLIESQPHPFIKNNRTMVPLGIIGAELGMEVNWDGQRRLVTIKEKETLPVETTPASNPVVNPPADSTANQTVPAATVDPETTICGEARVSAEVLKRLLQQNNPLADQGLVDLYLEIGKQYGIRGDIAFCQAAKETGWWKFGGLVQAYQNNYCGLAATGAAATGEEDLNGADPSRVRYEKGVHGAIFDSPATGVEAQMQHLYAYACKDPLPVGKVLLDPRFTKPVRGCAPRWVDLGGKWAFPGYSKTDFPGGFEDAFKAGKTYGHSILFDYYAKALEM